MDISVRRNRKFAGTGTSGETLMDTLHTIFSNFLKIKNLPICKINICILGFS